MKAATLASILEVTRDRVDRLRPRLDDLRARAADAPPRPSWTAAFGRPDVTVIAEIKRRSPSAGAISPNLDAGAQAAAYERGGARAISVLTDEPHFGGTLADVHRVTRSSGLPVLRKDFLIDPVQLYESRVAGASAVLLIVRALEGERLAAMAALAAELGLARLVEVHRASELDAAVAVRPEAIGVNSRDLDSFEVDLDGVAPVLGAVPADVVAVAESGIGTRSDVERVAGWGADAILVGTVLARASNPAESIRRFTGVSRVPRPSAEVAAPGRGPGRGRGRGRS